MSSIMTVSRVCRISQVASSASYSARRLFHGSARHMAITNFQMPAMSPTMTEGGIASWKKKEGELFVQGDVLLEIETDKATIDVEAQDDGVMGKILAPDGTKGVPVGKVIALLAEEGDDISNIEVPKEEAAPSTPPTENRFTSEPQPPQSPEKHNHNAPEHSRPLFPSVHRLLIEHGVTNAEGIKGTGVRGMLTKGDVLTFLGKASSPLGTFKFGPSPIEEALRANGATKSPATAPPPPLDGPALRRLVASSMLEASLKARNSVPAAFKDADFDSIIADYLPSDSQSIKPSISANLTTKSSAAGYLDGLF